MVQFTNFNFDLQANVCSTGKVLLSSKLYILECNRLGETHYVLGYYLNKSDALESAKVYADLDGYDDIFIDEKRVFL